VVLAVQATETALKGVMVEIQYFPVLPRLVAVVALVTHTIQEELVGLAVAVKELVLLAHQIRVIAADHQYHLKRPVVVVAQAQ